LLADSESFSNLISNRGLAFIICNNSYDFLVGYVSFIRNKIPVAFINDNIHQNLFIELLIRFKPLYVYSPSVSSLASSKWNNKYEFGSYNLYQTSSNSEVKIHKDLCLMLMTSGSTGSPEFVRISKKNILSNTISICDYLNIQTEDVAITTMPSSYSYGISIINTHLFKGSSIVMSNYSFMEKSFWDSINLFNVSTFSGVPFSFQMLKKLKFEKIHLPSIKYVTQAGGKLDEQTLKYFQEVCYSKKINFYVMYGQTEASPRMSYLPSEDLSRKISSIGIPIPGGKFKLKNFNGEYVDEPNIEGELVYFGDNVCMGYARSHQDLSLGDLNLGKLNTGDLAKFDSDGYFYITGRKKRFVKIYGNRISLDGIEDKLNSLGFSCACTGSDDQIAIFSENQEDCKKIQTFIIEHFKINKKNINVKYIDTIPRSGSGKIQYPKLNEYITL